MLLPCLTRRETKEDSKLFGYKSRVGLIIHQIIELTQVFEDHELLTCSFLFWKNVTLWMKFLLLLYL